MGSKSDMKRICRVCGKAISPNLPLIIQTVTKIDSDGQVEIIELNTYHANCKPDYTEIDDKTRICQTCIHWHADPVKPRGDRTWWGSCDANDGYMSASSYSCGVWSKKSEKGVD